LARPPFILIRPPKFHLDIHGPQKNAERVAAVREAIGPEIGRMMEDLNLTWFEEPVIRHDHEGEAKIAAALDTQIASGETIYTHRRIHQMLEARSADILMPDLKRKGGATELLKAGHLCEAYHLPCKSHLLPEMSLARLASLPGGYYLEHMPWFEALYAEHIELDAAGNAIVPDRPGWGFSFDPAAIARFKD
jgi:L-alanine-DL-glutamate epimerase-like enolase superfamily enzyme